MFLHLGCVMEITIDRNSSTPIYQQIVLQIREAIVSGSLPKGFILPPERRLAKALGVNRSTVLNAYRELKSDALVDSHVGRGTIVLGQQEKEHVQRVSNGINWNQYFRENQMLVQDPLIRDLLELADREDVTPLSIGIPDPNLLPLRQLQEVFNELVG